MEAGTNNITILRSPPGKLHTFIQFYDCAILVSGCGQSQGQCDDDQGGREVPQRPSCHHPHQHAQLQRQQH